MQGLAHGDTNVWAKAMGMTDNVFPDSDIRVENVHRCVGESDFANNISGQCPTCSTITLRGFLRQRGIEVNWQVESRNVWRRHF